MSFLYDLASTLGGYGKILLAISVLLAIPFIITYHPPTGTKCIIPNCYYNNATGQVTNQTSLLNNDTFTIYHQGDIITYHLEKYNYKLAWLLLTCLMSGSLMLFSSIILFRIEKYNQKNRV